MQKKLLINGRLVAGQGEVEDVLNPATGKVIARVAGASGEQVDAAVRAAESAFAGWAATPPKDRATLLIRLADRIEQDGPAFAQLESLNCGKPLAAALNDEIPAIADVFRFFAGAARTMHGWSRTQGRSLLPCRWARRCRQTYGITPSHHHATTPITPITRCIVWS